MALLPTLPPGITCIDWESSGDVTKPKRCKFMAREKEADVTEEALKKTVVRLGAGLVWRGGCTIQCSSVDKLPRLMCEEWLKANPGDRMPPRPPPEVVVEPPLPPVPRDLYGNILPDAPPSKAKVAKTILPGPPPVSGSAPPPPVLAEWIDALTLRGLEAKLQVGDREIHLVAKRSPLPRQELTFVEAAALRAVVDVFPGAVLVDLNFPVDETAHEEFEDAK